MLQREGSSRRYFYRFSDPIFQPYVVLNGLPEGLITQQQLRELQQRHPNEEPVPGDYEADGPQATF